MEITVHIATTSETVEYHRAGCRAAGTSATEHTMDSIEFIEFVQDVKAEQVALNVQPHECETRFHGCLSRG